jgi:hypothetical protein
MRVPNPAIWNNLILGIACVTLATVLGFAYGATFDRGCERMEAAGAVLGCVEFLLFRYQTLIGIAGAILAAFIAARPAWHQVLELQTQSRRSSRQKLENDDNHLRRERLAVERILALIRRMVVNESTLRGASKVSTTMVRESILNPSQAESLQLVELRDQFESVTTRRWGSPDVAAARGDVAHQVNVFRAAVSRWEYELVKFIVSAPENATRSIQHLHSPALTDAAVPVTKACLAYIAAIDAELGNIEHQTALLAD